MPDVQGAYEQLYSQVEEAPPDLDNAQSRQEYLAERMTERDESEGPWTFKRELPPVEEEPTA